MVDYPRLSRLAHHKGPYKRVGRMAIVRRRSEDGSRGWSDAIVGSGQWTKECVQPLKAGKGKETGSFFPQVYSRNKALPTPWF